MRKSTKIAGGIAVAGLIAAGGSAFTDSNTFASGATAPKTGYGSTTVSGATIDSLRYNLNAAGDNVDTVTLVLDGDTTGSAVSIGFNGGATTPCGTGSYDSAASPAATTYTCGSDTSGASFTQATSGLASTAVVVN